MLLYIPSQPRVWREANANRLNMTSKVVRNGLCNGTLFSDTENLATNHPRQRQTLTLCLCASSKNRVQARVLCLSVVDLVKMHGPVVLWAGATGSSCLLTPECAHHRLLTPSLLQCSIFRSLPCHFLLHLRFDHGCAIWNSYHQECGRLRQLRPHR